MRFKIDWASLIVGNEFTFFASFYFVFEGNFSSTSPRGTYIWRAYLTEGFLRYRFGGLYLEGVVHGGAYFRNFMVGVHSSSTCWHEKLLCYSVNIALNRQTGKRVGHLYIVALRGFSLGNQALPRASEQGHLYKPVTRPARRIGQEKNFLPRLDKPKCCMKKNFSSPNFSRGLHQLAQTRPTGPANKFVLQGLRGVSLERKLEITIFYCFDS